ncbi:hypothetical protein MSG28_013208 [Choristoneura fumiferana]|uniref:Uncharacterized protein n=1 Tax=Choristoneura fumiferana TaxID=7141 RepID=A0ACC0KSW9_CHOFU|nr:hypothetical protein MSG28_013208 [Choristoneura fumiferana]
MEKSVVWALHGGGETFRGEIAMRRMMERSNERFFLSRLPERISLEEERVMLCAFSGNLRATMDMLRESRRPSLRVRSDMDPLSPRLRPSGALLSSTSSPAPAIALSRITTVNPSTTFTYLTISPTVTTQNT